MTRRLTRRLTRPTRLTALTLTACLLAAACSDDPERTSSSRSSQAPSPASSAASPAASPSASAPFEADAARKTEESNGGPLSVVAVRVARQEGYDRVVFELDGRQEGAPGWQVEYVEDPRRDGSGEPVDVEGEKTLVVLIRGTGYPFDTGVEEVEGVSVPDDLEVIEDVVLGSVFEGVYEAFIGTSAEAPFRVFRLEDPTRLVVDVRHR